MAADMFRRAKLVKFIRTQEAMIQDTVETLKRMGQDPSDYTESRSVILDRLKDEFGITADELQEP